MIVGAVCGGTVATGEVRRAADVVIVDGRIAEIAAAAPRGPGASLDATGCLVAPGFVDAQVNGGFGIDLTTEPERVGELAALLPGTGVTAFLPTVITGPRAQRDHAIAVLGTHARRTTSPGCARVLGVHVEGPYLSPRRPGTHPVEHLRLPDPAEVARWAADPAVVMVTLAPELPGAAEAASVLDDAGTVVCAGHSDATAGQVAAAVADGHVRGVTHLFNAMSGLHHRAPGVAAAALTHPTLIAGIIVDGVHVDPTMVALAWRCLAPHRLLVVTDAMAAAGLGDGSYALGDVTVEVRAGVARSAGGVLAGSVLTMDAAVRRLVDCTGCAVEDAVAAATEVPAALLRSTAVGSIAVGRPADLVVLDHDLRVVATVIGGTLVHDPEGRATTSPVAV